MGLLGTLLKGVGKLAKKAASTVTHGASDHFLKGIKSLGQAKKILKRGSPRTAQVQALLNKSLVPRVKMTTVYADAAAGGGTPGSYARGGTAPRRRRRRTAAAAPATAPRRRRRRAAAAPGAAPRAKRKPPTGGLDFRALSRTWKAAGKPGTWQEWIRNHQLGRGGAS